MTDSPQDPTAAPEDLERFRDDFGRALFAAAREQDAVRRLPTTRPRRRRAAIGIAVAAAATVLVVTALPSPGDHDSPLLGASPAEAAVQQLRRSLREGVLVRRAETTQYGRTVERRTEEDWTDLATREQHVRYSSDDPKRDSEYWNPSKHERWTRGSRRAADGRPVVTHGDLHGAENTSSSQSPAEEVDDLLKRARNNDLVVRRTTTANGTKVLVLEQRQKCYADATNNAGVCPDPEKRSRWPQGGPAGLRPVTSFQTWWLQEGDTPRILRYENGAVAYGTTKRDVVYRSRYTRWDVLPATEQNLRLVRPPAFPADRFLVIEE
ncbi:hypothetical protein AB0L40_04215 [Patulibacter sp. NPDC049589]|uniref:hypothetical protein n=1 Tax=Patulibacter sp. NPDC049589 TaxID=3154731 RepID=UPI003442787A